MNKQIIVAAFAVFALTATATGSTFALFNDFETSTQNVFQAGTLDIEIGWEESINSEAVEIVTPDDNPGTIFNVTGIQPGDEGEATIEIANNGNPGYFWLKADQTGNYENNYENGTNPDEQEEEKEYYEVFLIENYPLNNLTEDRNYQTQERLERYAHGEVEGQVNGRGYPDQVDCIKNSTVIQTNETHAEVEFTLEDRYHCGTGTVVSLAAYEKPYEGHDESRYDELDLHHFNTAKYHPGKKHRITVALPQKEEQVDLDQGLMAHWKLDGTSSVAEDSSGNEYDLQVFNSPEKGVEGIHGDAYRFNAGESQKAISMKKAEIPETYSMSAWIKGDREKQVDENIYLMGYREISGVALQKHNEAGRTGMVVENKTNPDKKWNTHNLWGVDWKHQYNRTNILDDEWHHVTTVIDRNAAGDKPNKNSVKVYVDGKLIHSEAFNNHKDSEPRKLMVGALFDSFGEFTGKVDDARIYEREIQPHELDELMHSDEDYGKEQNTGSETEPVQEFNDTTPEKGELGQALQFTIWHDNGDNIQQPDEQLIYEGTAHQLDQSDIGESLLIDANTSETGINPIPSHGSKYLGFKWKLPEDTGCNVQTDEKVFDFTFESSQSRHNGNPFLQDVLFNDIEQSLNNRFKAGKFADCANETEQPPGNETPGNQTEKCPTCGPVTDAETDANYTLESTGDSSVKFDAKGDGLGEDGKVESHTFEITVEGASNETVYIRTKAGRLKGTAKLAGEGDTQLDTSGLWNLELVEINENEKGTTYTVKVTSDDERGYWSPALSNIEFIFCEPIEKKVRWQVDFTEGNKLHVPEKGGEDERLIMAALSQSEINSEDDLNPSVIYKHRLPEGVELREDRFIIDEDSATVKFEVEEGHRANLSTSSFVLPGPYEGDDSEEMDMQELYDSDRESFGPGKHNLTVHIPEDVMYEGITLPCENKTENKTENETDAENSSIGKYWQVDFAEGEVLKNLSELNYGTEDHMTAAWYYGNVDESVTRKENRPYRVDCVEDVSYIGPENGEAVVRFETDSSCNLTLAAYTKPYPDYDASRLGQQKLYNHSTRKVSAGQHEMRISLPEY